MNLFLWGNHGCNRWLGSKEYRIALVAVVGNRQGQRIFLFIFFPLCFSFLWINKNSIYVSPHLYNTQVTYEWVHICVIEHGQCFFPLILLLWLQGKYVYHVFFKMPKFKRCGFFVYQTNICETFVYERRNKSGISLKYWIVLITI